MSSIDVDEVEATRPWLIVPSWLAAVFFDLMTSRPGPVKLTFFPLWPPSCCKEFTGSYNLIMAIFSTAEQNMANASNRSRGQWEERAEGKRVDLLRGKGKSLGSFGLLVADATDLGASARQRCRCVRGSRERLKECFVWATIKGSSEGLNKYKMPHVFLILVYF